MITHINKKNKPIIVDISSKKETKRFAKAIGIVQFSKTTFNQIKSLTTKKGNIVNTAIIAGIIGSKLTFSSKKAVVLPKGALAVD